MGITLLSVAETARRYNVSRATVYEWLASDELEPSPLSPARPVMLDADDVARFVRARKDAGRWGTGNRGPDQGRRVTAADRVDAGGS